MIEISSIAEHLLDECQNRESYTECDISLLAIRIEDLSNWQRSKSCKPPGQGEQIFAFPPHCRCTSAFASGSSLCWHGVNCSREGAAYILLEVLFAVCLPFGVHLVNDGAIHTAFTAVACQQTNRSNPRIWDSADSNRRGCMALLCPRTFPCTNNPCCCLSLNSRLSHPRAAAGGPHSTCPLCFESVGSADDEDLWRAHLIEVCPRNPRRA